MKLLRFNCWVAFGLCLSILWSCAVPFNPATINSREGADRYLHEKLLPQIQVESQLVSDTEAYNVVIPPLTDSLPDPNTYPLYGAKPSRDANTVYIELYSSSEKANGDRRDERWLIDVAEQFNQQQRTLPSGALIQVGVRNIPSGLGAQILVAGKGKPTGYTPANGLWLELLKTSGLPVQTVAPALVPNQAVIALQPQAYQQLAQGGSVTIDRVIDAILAGKLKLGYANPYIASPALNFLYTLLWRAAGHNRDNQPLTITEIGSPQVSSAFSLFQKQITLTTPTYLDLKQIWLRNPQTFEAIVMAYQSYVGLKQQPGFENLAYVPFGLPESSPLVGFPWNTDSEREALKTFATFATSSAMQQLARNQGFEQTEYLRQGAFPTLPSGAVLRAAQSFWKERKDGGQTIYMELVVDTSGSMYAENRLKAVQSALRSASGQINRGNQVGLITFSDRPTRRLPLAPFNEAEQKRLFAAIARLEPDGNTALYDAIAVGLAELIAKQKVDPQGKFYLLVLTDGERTHGLQFEQLKNVIKYSGVRVHPIAYGEVNHQELEAIAAIREGNVYAGKPEQVQVLLKDLFQTNL